MKTTIIIALFSSLIAASAAYAISDRAATAELAETLATPLISGGERTANLKAITALIHDCRADGMSERAIRSLLTMEPGEAASYEPKNANSADAKN